MSTPRVLAAVVAACAIAVPAEGLRQYAYRDPPGIMTVCWGSTTDVQPDREYSLDECRARLTDDMTRAVQAVERCAPGLPESVLVAFSDAVFNVGPVIACDRTRSTAARLLHAGQWRAACEQLLRWDKARVAGQLVTLPGLTKRRARERDTCLSGLA